MNWFQRFFTAFGSSLIEKIRIGGHDVSEGILHLLDFSGVFYFSLGPWQIPVTKAMVNILLTVLILPVLYLLLAQVRKKSKSGRLSSTVESLLGMLNNLCRQAGLNEEQTEKFAPFAGALFVYIALSNILAVISVEAAAVNPAFPIALAFFNVLCIIIWGISFVGVKGFLKSLLAPVPFMLPFNLLDYVIKPISLAFRLFGNIFGASILIAFLKAIIPLFLPQVLGLWFEVGDGFVQALVFMYLSVTYVGEIVEKAHGSHETKEVSRKVKTADTAVNS